jgi:hypothetical protein
MATEWRQKQPATVCNQCEHVKEEGWFCMAKRILWSVLTKEQKHLEGPPYPKCELVNDGKCTYYERK